MIKEKQRNKEQGKERNIEIGQKANRERKKEIKR